MCVGGAIWVSWGKINCPIIIFPPHFGHFSSGKSRENNALPSLTNESTTSEKCMLAEVCRLRFLTS